MTRLLANKLLLSFLSFSLLACSWRGPQPARAGAQVERTDLIQVLDEAAWNAIQVEYQRSARNAAGRYEVSLELTNRGDANVTVMARTLFREYDGTFSDGEPLWETIFVPGGGSAVYSCTSLTNRAALYTVEIKTP